MEKNTRMIGQLLIDAGKITKEELEKILNENKEGKQIGQLLIEKGKIKKEDLEGALVEQKQLLTTGVKSKKLKVGDLLLKLGKITEEDLENALRIKEMTKEKIGEILVREGVITQKDINDAIEKQTGVKTVDLKTYKYEGETYKIITKRLAEMYKVLLLEKDETSVRLAMNDPFDLHALDSIMLYTGLEVIPVFAKKVDLLDKIDELYDK